MFIFICDPPLPAACAKGTTGEKLVINESGVLDCLNELDI